VLAQLPIGRPRAVNPTSARRRPARVSLREDAGLALAQDRRKVIALAR